MTPSEFHDACHEACMECPQFDPYDNDQYFEGYGEFGDIPKKGWRKVIKFWKDDRLLWEMGYSQALPEEVKELFDRIDALFYDTVDRVLRGEK